MSFGEFYAATSGIGKAYSDGLAQFDKKQMLGALGTKLQSGDYAGASKLAFDAGDPDTGLSLLKLGQTAKQSADANAAFTSFGQSYAGGGTPQPLGALGAQLAPPAPRPGASLPSFAQGSDIGRYAGAIQSNESGGNYGIVGPTHPKYGRALGAYQVMESNLPSWSREAVGREVTPDEFLKSPQIQDAIFQKKFGQAVEKYGNPQDAASVWFTGRPLAQGANARDVLGTTGQRYVDKFTAALNRGAPSAAPQLPVTAMQMPALDAPARGAPVQVASADRSFVPTMPNAAQAVPAASAMGSPPVPMPGAPTMTMPGNEPTPDVVSGTTPEARAQVSATVPQQLAQAGLPSVAAQQIGSTAPGSQQRISALMRMAAMPGMSEGQASVIKVLLSNELEQSKLPDTARQYLFAKSAVGGGFDGSYADFVGKSKDEGAKIQAQLKARQDWLVSQGLDPKDPGNQAWIMGGKTAGGHVLKPGDILAGPGGKTLAQNASTASSMPDETANFLAERVLAGDNRALIGLGRGAQGAENLTKIQGLVAQKAAERGLDGTDLLYNASKAAGINAQERSLGTSAGRMAAASVEAEGAIKLGIEASAAVPRGSFVPLNRAVQMVQSNTGDPALKQFVAANNTIVNTFARAISPSGAPTVSDKEHAREMLSTADSHEAYVAVLQQMQKEIDMAHKAPQQASAGLERERQAAKRGETSQRPTQTVPNPLAPGGTLDIGASTVIDGTTIRRVR